MQVNLVELAKSVVLPISVIGHEHHNMACMDIWQLKSPSKYKCNCTQDRFLSESVLVSVDLSFCAVIFLFFFSRSQCKVTLYDQTANARWINSIVQICTWLFSHYIFFVVCLPVAAANDRYVLRIARCCCVMSFNSAELKLGQNNHRNIVPIMANKSDV